MEHAEATLVARELKSMLQQISRDNDYLTDLGESVHRGFYAHVLKNSGTTFPAVCIHNPVEQLRQVQGKGKNASLDLYIPVVIATEVGLDDEAYDLLSNSTRDVRKAIFSQRDRIFAITREDDLEIDTAEPEMSEDSRFALTAFNVVVMIKENYES